MASAQVPDQQTCCELRRSSAGSGAPLCAFVDHGPNGTGEMATVALRPGNAGPNTDVDHIAVTRSPVAQLPAHLAGGSPDAAW